LGKQIYPTKHASLSTYMPFWHSTDTLSYAEHIPVCPTRYRTRQTGWLAGWPLLRVATIRCTTNTFLFISHTTNVLLFKFRCNIFTGVRIIKEMPGSVASGTQCTYL